MSDDLTYGELFAGVGGFGLGLERAGWTGRWTAEWDRYRRAVLSERFPHAQHLEDVRHVTAETVEPVKLIAAGFPCTNVSNAGDRTGLDGTESSLWSEVVRVVRELRPDYLLVENVSALLARGFGRVLGDLAESGFDAEWDCIPAAAVGAPHRRDRIWLVAYAHGAGRPQPRRAVAAQAEVAGAERGDSVPPDSTRGLREGDVGPGLREGEPGEVGRGRPRDDAGAGAAEPAAERFRATLPGWREPVEPFGAVAGRAAALGSAPEPFLRGVDAGLPFRVDRVDALGDSLCPVIAEWLGLRIRAYEARIAAQEAAGDLLADQIAA